MARTTEEVLGGYVITGCGIVNRANFMFSLDPDDEVEPWKTMIAKGELEPVKARIATHNIVRGSWGWVDAKQYHNGVIAGGIGDHGSIQGVMANHLNGVIVFNYENGANGGEPTLSRDIASGVFSLRYIGDSYYGCGNERTLVRRLPDGRWEGLNRVEDGGRYNDLDGFSETEIYVVGNEDAFSMWDGERLISIDPGFEGGPWSKVFHADSVCCGGDGRVYVSGSNAELIAGRHGDGWETLIPQRKSNLGTLRSLAWYDGTLYGVSDKQMFVYDPDGARWKVKLWNDENSPASFGFMSVKDGIMLVAGPFGANWFDGTAWHRIWGEIGGLDIVRMELTKQQVDAAEKGYNSVDELIDRER